MSPRASFRLLCTSTLFHFLAVGIFLSALPLYLTQELGASKARVGLVIGAFSITALASRPFVGRRIDRYGRRWFLRAAPAIIGLTALGLLWTGGFVAVLLLRLVQGVAGSSFYTAAATVTTDLAPPHRRASFISRFSLFLYAGFAAGPALGELLIERVDYWAAWAAAVGLSAISFTVTLLVPESSPAHRDAVRSRGVLGQAEGDETVQRVLTPELPKFRLGHPAAVGPGLVLMTIAFGYTAISSFLPLYSRSIGMGSSGALYATFAGTILLVRLVSGKLADRYGRATVAFPGLVSGAVGMFLIAAIERPVAVFVGVALFGAGHAIAFPALMALTVDRVRENERGEALGSFTAFFDIGAAIGGYLVGFTADQAGFSAAWAAPGVLCLGGLVALGFVARRARLDALAVAGEPSRRGAAEPVPDIEPAGT